MTPRPVTSPPPTNDASPLIEFAHEHDVIVRALRRDEVSNDDARSDLVVVIEPAGDRSAGVLTDLIVRERAALDLAMREHDRTVVAGLAVRLICVGVAFAAAGLKPQCERWARAGGGLYFNASSSQELAEAVDRALRPKFQVVDVNGEILGEGTAGLDPVEVPVGAYTVRILTSPLRTVGDVQVQSQDTTHVVMPPPGAGEG